MIIGYAKQVDGYWRTCKTQLDETWVEIESDISGCIISPQGLVEQLDTSPTLSDCRCAKLAEMRKECGERIAAGFDCDALGYPCQYRNTEDDQLAMQKAAMLDGGKIWRNEKLTSHTKAQALLVYAESSSEIDRLKTTYDNKCAYINDQSRTSDEINAVTWDSVES